MKKRLLLIGLILTMLMACFTVSVSASDRVITDGSMLQTFLKNVYSDQTFNLNSDISGSWVIKAGQKVTINLNGFSISYADIGSGAGSSMFKIESGAELIIINNLKTSEINLNSSKRFAENFGTLTVDGNININCVNILDYSYINGAGIYARDNSKTYLKGNTIINGGYGYKGGSVCMSSNATFIMQDQAALQDANADWGAALWFEGSGNDVKMKDKASIKNCIVDHNLISSDTGGNTITMSGESKIINCSTRDRGYGFINIGHGSTLNMEDSSSITDCNCTSAVSVDDSGSALNMTGKASIINSGECVKLFNFNVNSHLNVSDDATLKPSSGKSAINSYGGVIRISGGFIAGGISTSGNNNIRITGGQFDSKPGWLYNSEVVQLADDTSGFPWIVWSKDNPIQNIDTNMTYTSFEKAWKDDAKNLKLLKDFVSSRISFDGGKEYILDLNGHALTNAVEKNDGYELIFVDSDTTLHIKDSSSSKAGKIAIDQNTAEKRTCTIQNNGMLYIESGTISYSVKSAPLEGHAIYNVFGTLVISGDAKLYNCYSTSDGAGIWNYHGSITLKDNAVIDCCSTGGNGGAIYSVNDSSKSITMQDSSVIKNCSAGGNGGAIALVYNSTYSGRTNPFAMKDKATITGCSAGVNGGAIYMACGSITIEGSAKISGSNLSEKLGGAIYANSGSITIKNSAAESNVVVSGSSKQATDSGTIHLAGDASMNVTGLVNITNTLDKKSNYALYLDTTGLFNLKDAILNGMVKVTNNYTRAKKDNQGIGVCYSFVDPSKNGNDILKAAVKESKTTYLNSVRYNCNYAIVSAADTFTVFLCKNDGTDTVIQLDGFKVIGIDLPTENEGKSDVSYYIRGFKLASWNSVPSGSGITYEVGKIIDGEDYDKYMQEYMASHDGQKTADGAMYIYAQWESDPNVERKIKYKDPSGNNDDKYDIAKGTSIFTAQGANFFLKKPVGYVLTSWNTRADGSGTKVPFGWKIDIGFLTDVTVYAQWTLESEVEHQQTSSNLNKIVYVDSIQDSDSNEPFEFDTHRSFITVTSMNFTREGYAFDFWSRTPNPVKDSSGRYANAYYEGDLFEFNPTPIQVTLYAIWKPKDQGRYQVTDKTEATDVTIQLSSKGGVKEVKGSRGSSFGSSSAEGINTLIYHSNTATGDIQTYKTDDDYLEADPIMFYRDPEYFSFVCWNTEPDGSGTTYKAGSSISFEDSNYVDLYAIWCLKESSIIAPPVTPYQGEGEAPDFEYYWDYLQNRKEGESYEEYLERVGKNPGGSGSGSGSGSGGSGSGSGSGSGTMTFEEAWKKLQEEQQKASQEKKAEMEDKKTGKKIIFDDSYENRYYTDALKWAYEMGITDGFKQTTDAEGNTIVTFGPASTCTRAQMVTFIWRVAGCPEPKTKKCAFTDVVKGSYYEKAVLWGVEQKIIEGTSDTTFSPSDECTRAQTLTFLWRTQGRPKSWLTGQYADVAVDKWYTEAIDWAGSTRLLENSGTGYANPSEDCPRAEMITYLYRVLAK